jgi:hypothetical protein
MRVLSIHERVGQMQEKDPAKTYVGEFSIYLKSGLNVPERQTRHIKRVVRIMVDSNDE